MNLTKSRNTAEAQRGQRWLLSQARFTRSARYSFEFNWSNGREGFKSMKSLLVFAFIALATANCWSQSMTYPSVLTNELTGLPLSGSATKCIVLIHGWNPSGASNCYDVNNGYEFFNLITNLKLGLKNTDWNLVAYHWEADANTGPIGCIVNGVWPTTAPNQAATNAELHGAHLATQLNTLAPNLREVHFIAHSAGSWAARMAIQQLLQINPYVVVQMTLLDPYVPNPSGASGSDFSDDAMNQALFFFGFDRIQRLENYYADDSFEHGWNAYPWGNCYPPTANTQEAFSWREGIDITQEIDWGNVQFNPPSYLSCACDLPASFDYLENYDWHAGPIQFYADTVYANDFPGTVPSGLTGTGCPFAYQQIGWNRSLRAWESWLPQVTGQPVNQSTTIGGSATFNVVASQATSFDWYKVGGNWVGSGSTLTLYNVSSSNAGNYVVRVANSNGQLYSQPASLNVGSAPLIISSVSPATLTGLPLPQTQLIRIIGSGFTSSSTLTFNDGVDSPFTGRVPIFISANELDYNITVGPNAANWRVQVINGSQQSNLGAFTVTAQPPPSVGSLSVTLQPAGAVSAGAQWEVDGTGYNNSGQVVGYLTPGLHTVSFKSVAGYTAPTSHSVSITGGNVTSDTETYGVVAPTTYTLTLNQGGSTGYIVNQPFGSGSGNIYNAGAVVQLTAYADPGYHFVSWSVDGSGTANPITITMNGNKTVAANFAAGDPNMGTITVTIQPPEAAEAGVTWGFNDNDFRASGSSYSQYPETVYVFLHGTNDWVGVGGWVTFTAGQTTTYTFTASYTNGTIIGSDPRTYFTLAGSAGNSGSADGTNNSASFNRPWSLTVDNSGNIFVADTFNELIRKVSPLGVVTTIAGKADVSGYADGSGTNAIFNYPVGIAVDSSDNLYIAEFYNSVIRKIDATGMVTTLAGLATNTGSADGNGAAARFYFPAGVAVDTNGNVYVADSVNETIRKIAPNGDVSTLAGLARSYGSADGTGNVARFFNPQGLAVDSSGNIYVADEANETVRKVTPAGVVTTLAGFPQSAGAADGTGNSARFQNLNDVAVDASGNIYVADTGNDAIRKVTQGGVVTTLAGQSGNPGSADGIGSIARFNNPGGVAVDSMGNLFVSDVLNHTIRATEPLTNRINQSIVFTPIPDHSAGDAPFTITATASSGLPVYLNVLSGPAVLSSNVVTLLGAGTVTINAWQPGDSNYNAAATVQQSFTVTKVPQSITFGPLSQQTAGDAPFSLGATASSGLPVTFTLVSGPASLSGNIVTLTGGGTVTVSASQPGNSVYAAALSVSQSFFVAPPPDTVGDGIPDAWRAQYFPNSDPTGTTTNNLSCATCDADGTGQNNLFKFVAGLNPTNSASVFVLQIQSVPNQPTQKNLIYGPIVSSCTYVIESTTNLVGGVWSPQAVSAPLTNITQVTVMDANATSRQKFYRVSIYNVVTNIVVLDSVGDGIPDSWRMQYFPLIPPGDGTATNSSSCATCDADGTGQNNFFKYVAGLDPTNPASVFVLNVASTTNQFRTMNLDFNPLALGRTYAPQFRTNLASGVWLPLTTYSGLLTNGGQVTITDTNPIPPQEFYRIDISLP
jgi:sugar lactone lactonase YvrE